MSPRQGVWSIGLDNLNVDWQLLVTLSFKVK